MLGMEYAKATTLDLLRDHLPAKLVELRARYGAPGAPLPAVKPRSDLPFLPDVEEWLIGDPRVVPVSKYPAVAVSGLDDAVRPHGDDSYRVLYRLRAFVYVREQSYAAVEQQRDRLVLGIRELLFSAPGLLDPTGAATLHRDRLVESYSDVVDDGAKRSLGGAYIELMVGLNEELDRSTGLFGDITRGTVPAPIVTDLNLAARRGALPPVHPAL
jgi:hypothetical protein